MEKKSLLLLVIISFLVFSILVSFVSAYTFNDVLSGKVSFSNYIKEKMTGKAVVQDAEAKGFTFQGTWLKSWIPNLKSVYNGDILIGDFNGDGKTDIGMYIATSGEWLIATSTGTGFDTTAHSVWLGPWLPKRDYGEGNTFTGDFNGDGKTDVGVYDAVNGNWLVALSTGTGFSTKTQGWLSGWLSYKGYGYIGETFTGDFNGDGKTDIGVYDSPTGNWFVALSNGNGFDAKDHNKAGDIWLESWLSGYSGNIFTGDFNGDKKTDIGVYDSINGNWLVALSTGTGFTAKYTWLKSWLPKRDYGEGNIFTGDFNGDKKTDIGVYDAMNGNWLVALASEPVILTDTGGVYSSGGGFSTKNQGWLSGWLPKRDYGEGNTFTGDFNGDGKTDIGVYDSMNGNWLVALATSTPSYCVDTDNGAVYTKKGNVYGVELGNAFDKADYCLDSTLIREYYCHGANAVISDYTCRDGGVCQDGACVMPTQPAPTCTDSDGGLNYDVIGSATGTDYTGGVNTINDGCIIGGLNDGWLREAVCKDNVATWSDYNCPNGCSEGVCVNAEQTQCTDSDGGLNYYTKGSIVGSTIDGSSTDECVLINGINTLVERYCTNAKGDVITDATADKGATKDYVCPNGCSEGVCIDVTPTCTDTDGGKDYYVKGEVSYGGEVFTDVCGGFLWWAELKENYCDGDIRAAEKVRCPKASIWNSKCSDGRCSE